MDKTLMRTPRLSKSYEHGVAAFIWYAVNHLKEVEGIYEEFHKPCPCKYCLNHYALPIFEVDEHLFSKGFDPTNTNGLSIGKRMRQVIVGLLTPTMVSPRNLNILEWEFPLMPYTIEMVEVAEGFAKDPVKFKKILEDAEKPLYKGPPNFTELSAIFQLFSLKSKHRESDMLMNLTLVKEISPWRR